MAPDTVPGVGRPATGKTFVARARIPLDTWNEFEKAASAAGTDRSKVLNEFVEWYLRRRGAHLPARPDPKRVTD